MFRFDRPFRTSVGPLLVLLCVAGLALAAEPGGTPEERLVGAGFSPRHAREVLEVAGGLDARGLAALLDALESAYERGAEPRELVNLTEDLVESGLDTDAIADAIDDVGDLASEGWNDADTRRRVGLRAADREAQAGPSRKDERPAHDGRRHDARTKDDEVNGGAGEGADSHREDLRDELRREKPPGLKGKGDGPKPAGEHEREEREKEREKKDKEDKEKGEGGEGDDDKGKDDKPKDDKPSDDPKDDKPKDDKPKDDPKDDTPKDDKPKDDKGDDDEDDD